jgi:putative ubiquitin-RnfH superfamily antitoxin RatB of RatAB toxin-antitoxin module
VSTVAIDVEVVFAAPDEQVVRRVSLPDGATIVDALAASGLTGTVTAAGVGIWGRSAEPDALLRDGDRVELYRPLTADPKEARRSRAKRAAR